MWRSTNFQKTNRANVPGTKRKTTRVGRSYDPIRLSPEGQLRDDEKEAKKQSRLAFKRYGPDMVEVQN